MSVNCGEPISPSVLNNAYISKDQYATDAEYETASAALGTGFPSGAHIYYNTTDNQFRFYDGTSWKPLGEVLSLTGTNEAIVTDVNGDYDVNVISRMTNSDTDANAQAFFEAQKGSTLDASDAGKFIYFNTTDSKPKYWDGSAFQLFSSTGSGSIPQSDIENNNVFIRSEYASQSITNLSYVELTPSAFDPISTSGQSIISISGNDFVFSKKCIAFVYCHATSFPAPSSNDLTEHTHLVDHKDSSGVIIKSHISPFASVWVNRNLLLTPVLIEAGEKIAIRAYHNHTSSRNIEGRIEITAINIEV